MLAIIVISSKVCVLPKGSPSNCGEGRRSRRYFYNFKTGRCESFVYNGCGGNSNNFMDRQECEVKCGKLFILRQYSSMEVCIM